MGAITPNVLNQQVLADGMPVLWDLDNSTTYDQLVKNAAKKWKITRTPNGTDFRAPLKMRDAGIYGAVDLAGGDLGETNGPDYKQMTQSAKSQHVGFEFNHADDFEYKNGQLSKLNPSKDTIANAIRMSKRYANASLFSDGFTGGAQGLIAKGTAYGGGVFTFETSFGPNLLVPGMAVEIFDTTLATHRTTGLSGNLPKVASVAHDAGQATLTNLGAVSPVATDYLAFPGVGATPAWVNGLYYFNNPSSSGSILGLSKATYPQLIPVSENAAGSAITISMGYKLKIKMQQRRGKNIGKLTGITHPVIAAQWLLLAPSIAQFQRGAGAMPAIDLAAKQPTGNDQLTMWEMPVTIDPLASKSRVDFVKMDDFGCVMIQDINFYRSPKDGSWVFEKRGSAGQMKAAWMFYTVWAENFVHRDPGANGVIYGLATTV